MNGLVRQVARAIEQSARPVVRIQRYDREEAGRVVRQQEDVILNPQERRADAISILRLVDKLPPYEHAVVLGLAGDPAMLEGAIISLLDVVDRDCLGDGPAKEAIRYWMRGNGMSKRQLSKEYGGSPTTHYNYRQKVADELDRLLTRAVSMCRNVA